jgi:hypothetical protein
MEGLEKLLVPKINGL